MAFLGRFDHQLDDKKRVAIPARYRDQFDKPAYLTASPDGCIAVYPKAAFDSAAAEVLEVSAKTPEGRGGRRQFFGLAADVPKDSQGRLLVPAPLLEHAQLKKDVVVIGAGEYFELWDRDVWVAATAGEATSPGEE